MAEVTAIDFFNASGRESAERVIFALDARLQEALRLERRLRPNNSFRTFRVIPVTRKGIHVDRMASAWLIRRFIDPNASFKFVSAKGYQPEPEKSDSTCTKPNLPTKGIAAPLKV